MMILSGATPASPSAWLARMEEGGAGVAPAKDVERESHRPSQQLTSTRPHLAHCSCEFTHTARVGPQVEQITDSPRRRSPPPPPRCSTVTRSQSVRGSMLGGWSIVALIGQGYSAGVWRE